MGLSAATTLNELGSLTHHLSGIQAMVTHHIVAHHNGELGLILILRAKHAEQRTFDGSTDLEGQVLGCGRLQRLHAAYFACLSDELVAAALHGLCLERLDLLFHGVVLVDIFPDDALQVLGIVEERLHGLQQVLGLVKQFLTLLARLGLNTTNAGSNAGLADNLEEANATR